jgi:charged multivesicular body protein 5
MKAANKDLKKAYKDINIGDVEDLHDDMSDMLQDAEEINEVLGQAYGVPEDIDESDLMDGGRMS